MEWEKINLNGIYGVYEYANCFYQQLMYRQGEHKIYADAVEYDLNGERSYELTVQIPEELSITGMTTNVKSFSYEELDFKRFEKDAKKLIKGLIK